MAAKQIDFSSPGVRINEIDNTGRVDVNPNVGPVIFGRAERGPSTPTRIESFDEFIRTFGYPIAGGRGGDVWREGNNTAPAYGGFAAQAWLKNASPITYVRLLGYSHADATTAGVAGWETQDSAGAATGIGNTDANGGAYGLFIVRS